MPCPELVLDRVKRCKVEVAATNWPMIIAEANALAPANKKIAQEKQEEEARRKTRQAGGLGAWSAHPEQADPEHWTSNAVDLSSAWSFEDRSRFFWTHLLPKLNTHLYGRSVSIEHHNGFELYRIIVKAIDELPENAKFLMGAEMSQMV